MVPKIFYLIITVLFYFLAKKINRKKPGLLFSPIILTPVMLIVLLLVLDLPYEDYANGTFPLNELLDVVTVALAIPLYRNWSFIAKNWRVILFSLSAGSLIAVVSGVLTTYWLEMGQDYVISIIPRIVTIPVAVSLSESIGGIPTITVLFSMMTCFVGVFLGPHIIKRFSIKHPLSIGMMYGLGAQALGTAKAFKTGELEGTASSVSYILTAIITVVWALILTPVINAFLV
ncbi:LrgB family protein [Lentibacillus sp. Marseille-P4043]|uniref:LrgB family protein n=1 Tax=Lentibacillus sp. Marseille-P4043 TaxID=2040293 RepID=UPI000D0AE840|nr:LrgB family protein [Lentibacillus sp. Marseille-P4043]